MSSNGAPAIADQALVASPSSPTVSTEGFDPSRSALVQTVRELLDPLRGVERGLLDEDSDTLLINIRVGELRKIGMCLRMTQRLLGGTA